MSEMSLAKLPTGWAIAHIRDVANTGSGYGFPTDLQGRDAGEIPFAKVSDISNAVKGRLRYLESAANYVSQEDARSLGASALPTNTIVFAKIGGAIELNRRVILGRSIIVDNNVMGLSPERGIEPLYLYYFMLTQRLGTLARATTVPSLRRGDIENLQFPLPSSAEQWRIVEALDELFSDLDSAVATLERVQAKLKLYRATVLKAAVEGTLTAEWREQHPATEPAPVLLTRILAERRRRWEEAQLKKFKEAGKEPRNNWKAKYKEPSTPTAKGLPSLPESWCWASVEQVSTKVVDGVHKKPDYVSSGIPFVTVRNLTAGPGISLAKLNYITREDHVEFTKRADPELGDILISKDGTLGVVRVVKSDTVFSIFVSVALVKPVLGGMGDYLGLALSSPQVQGQMVPKGSGLVHIHLEDLREDCVPLAPLPEQEAIVEAVEDQLSVIEHLDADLEAKVKSAQGLRQSILRHAFSGQLVPQDPNDEPAAELLKRIAVQREKLTKEAATTREATLKVKKSTKKPSPRRTKRQPSSA